MGLSSPEFAIQIYVAQMIQEALSNGINMKVAQGEKTLWGIWAEIKAQALRKRLFLNPSPTGVSR